jgi:uncharacterized protein (DUF305 family)
MRTQRPSSPCVSRICSRPVLEWTPPMQRRVLSMSATCALMVFATTACSSATRSGVRGVRPPDDERLPYTTADVRFISSMIPHHGQAVLMAGWAPTHDASPAVRTLSERIVVGQRDEIEFMQRWLRERNEPVPEPGAVHGPEESDMDHAGMNHAGMDHDGIEHAMLMPGMLTAEELAELDRARGAEFDRLFLTFMIRHHQGAVTMVEQLFSARGAAQDEAVFRFAADVQADQVAEIDRMSRMLAALSGKETDPSFNGEPYEIRMLPPASGRARNHRLSSLGLDPHRDAVYRGVRHLAPQRLDDAAKS